MHIVGRSLTPSLPLSQPTEALFGKKKPAAPGTKKAAVKPFAKKPPAKKPVAKKPVAKKPVAKKPVASKPLFSLGGAKPAASKTAKKSKYNISKTAGTVKKSKPTTFKTVDYGKYGKKKPVKKAAVRPMGGKPVERAPKPAVYDKEQVGTLGVASIFAGTFLLTLATLPAATEAALEVIGIGYSAYFAYNWVTNPESRDELDKTLTKIDDETGINLKAVASAITNLAGDVSKKLAEQAEKSAEQAAKAKVEKAKVVKEAASNVVDKVEPAVEKPVAAKPAAKKPTFKEAVKEAVKEAENK